MTPAQMSFRLALGACPCADLRNRRQDRNRPTRSLISLRIKRSASAKKQS